MSTEGQEATHSTPAEGRRIAFIVGVNGQSIPGRDALKYAEQDASDLAQVLQDCGYELFRSPLVGGQATTDQVKKAVLALAKAISDDDLVVFYFSGHGVFKLLSDNVEDIYALCEWFRRQDQLT